MYFDSWQGHELRVAIMRNALESGVDRKKSKVTQELVERNVKKKNIQEIQVRK